MVGWLPPTSGQQELASKVFMFVCLWRLEVVRDSPNRPDSSTRQRVRSGLICRDKQQDTWGRKRTWGHIKPCLVRSSRGSERFHQQKAKGEYGVPTDDMNYDKWTHRLGYVLPASEGKCSPWREFGCKTQTVLHEDVL